MFRRVQLATVFIIDDEISVRRSLERLMLSAGVCAHGFESVEDFLSAEWMPENCCVISDIRMPGMSGLELPAALKRMGKFLPVIYVTAHDTPEARQEALCAGGAAFFHKPVDDQMLLDAIEEALERVRPNE